MTAPVTPLDSPSFAREISARVPRLRRRALALSKNPVDADDLVQDTIVRALRFAHTFQRGTNLDGWLRQILTSVFISRCRRLTRERRALEALTVDPCAWTRPEAGSPMGALSPPVERALADLPEKFSDVVALVDLADHSYREAAEELDVPIGTVMSRLSRGRRMLATNLREDVSLQAAA